MTNVNRINYKSTYQVKDCVRWEEVKQFCSQQNYCHLYLPNYIPQTNNHKLTVEQHSCEARFHEILNWSQTPYECFDLPCYCLCSCSVCPTAMCCCWFSFRVWIQSRWERFNLFGFLCILLINVYVMIKSPLLFKKKFKTHFYLLWQSLPS